MKYESGLGGFMISRSFYYDQRIDFLFSIFFLTNSLFVVLSPIESRNWLIVVVALDKRIVLVEEEII